MYCIILSILNSHCTYGTREKHYTDEQASAFITLLLTLIENIKSEQKSCMQQIHIHFILVFQLVSIGKQLSLRDNYKEFERTMEAVGGKASSLKCFTNEVGIDVIRYISRSLFQHYHLYQYLFTGEQQQETITTRVSYNNITIDFWCILS